MCIVCCDGLTGLADAITVTRPQAAVQLCVVHLIRASLRYASKKYWVPLARDLKLIYIAADEAAAAAALDAFAATRGDRYPAIVKLWRAHWEQFTPSWRGAGRQVALVDDGERAPGRVDYEPAHGRLRGRRRVESRSQLAGRVHHHARAERWAVLARSLSGQRPAIGQAHR